MNPFSDAEAPTPGCVACGTFHVNVGILLRSSVNVRPPKPTASGEILFCASSAGGHVFLRAYCGVVEQSVPKIGKGVRTVRAWGFEKSDKVLREQLDLVAELVGVAIEQPDEHLRNAQLVVFALAEERRGCYGPGGGVEPASCVRRIVDRRDERHCSGR